MRKLENLPWVRAVLSLVPTVEEEPWLHRHPVRLTGVGRLGVELVAEPDPHLVAQLHVAVHELGLGQLTCCTGGGRGCRGGGVFSLVPHPEAVLQVEDLALVEEAVGGGEVVGGAVVVDLDAFVGGVFPAGGNVPLLPPPYWSIPYDNEIEMIRTSFKEGIIDP